MLTPHNAPEGFGWIVSLDAWRLEHSTLTLTGLLHSGNRVDVIVRAETRNIWRMVMVPPGSAIPIPTGMVVDPLDSPCPLKIEEDKDGIRVKGARLTLQIDRNPWAVRFLDTKGKEVLAENPGDVDGLGRLFILPLGFANGPAGISCVTESFHLRQDEHLFGLGEKFTPLDKRQQKIVTWTQDAFGSTSERSHKNIPFIWSTKGYGIFLNSGARMTWDMGTTSNQTLSVISEDTLLDMFVLYGPTPAQILQHYSRLTGFAPQPPAWSFGLWMSSGGTYRDRASIEKLIEGIDSHDMPADVIHIDPWWMRWRMYCDFVWNEEAFPRAKEFIDTVHAKGLKVCLWEHPYISVESPLFEYGKGNGFFAKTGDGDVYVIDYGLSLAPRPDGVVRTAAAGDSWNAKVAIVDLTNEAASRWFKDLHRPMLQLGIDVFKTDFGEDIPVDAVFADGESGRTMHNRYPLLYNKIVYEVTKEERGYGIVWGRAGTTGSQRFPVCWSGDPASDFDSLACTIRGGLSVGMSGIPFWSNDIGGYRGMPSENLYVRWAQFGLFCSHSRMHGDSPREPWFFSKKALDIVRSYASLRYQLLPYLRNTAEESCRTGLPVMRALPVEFPDDINTYDKDLEYMLGPWLLVAPIYDKSNERTVYLPEGTWIDYWSGKKHEGPCTIQKKAPLNILPLFVRSGAIIPMMKPARRVPASIYTDPLLLDLYPSGESTYQLVEGKTKTKFVSKCERGGMTFKISGSAPRRMIEVRLNGLSPVGRISVRVDGRKLRGSEFRMKKGRRPCIAVSNAGKKIHIKTEFAG